MEIEKKMEEIQNGLEKAKNAELAVVEVKQSIDNIDQSIEELKKEVKNIATEKKAMSQVDALVNFIASDEFAKEVKAALSDTNFNSKRFEVKATVSTSAYTGDVARSFISGSIAGANVEPNSMLAIIPSYPVPADKNKPTWLEGAYTSNAAYATEATAASTDDAATMTEASRELAKVHAVFPFSAETASDMSAFVSWARNKGIENIKYFVDNAIISGAGAAGANAKQIWGLTGQGSTAFSAASAGLATAIAGANVYDLIGACKTQIRKGGKGAYKPTHLIMNPTDAQLLRSLKSTDNKYISVLPDGSNQILGLTLIETEEMAAGSLLVLSINTIRLYEKQMFEIELERRASTDSYAMYVRYRGQVVVPTEDKKGNIYVAAIGTAVTAITKA